MKTARVAFDIFLPETHSRSALKVETIRIIARWLGYRRTGHLIEETTRSLINGLLRDPASKRTARIGSGECPDNVPTRTMTQITTNLRYDRSVCDKYHRGLAPGMKGAKKSKSTQNDHEKADDEMI